jgi:hypothetical protein
MSKDEDGFIMRHIQQTEIAAAESQISSNSRQFSTTMQFAALSKSNRLVNQTFHSGLALPEK